jgi:predicted AlkP superfamily phosphohydrolase/phosphomutase
LYHYLQWHAQRMTVMGPDSEWLPQRVFWRDAAAAGRRVVAIDMPSVYAPEPINGIDINGWSNADLLAPPSSYPPDVLPWAERTFGRAQLGSEASTIQPRALKRLRDALIRCTGQTCELALSLMQRESWDLFLVNFTATHRGGHKLWGRDDLRDVYAACDAAVGRLVERASPSTALVFSVHGMGPNTSRVHALPQMLEQVLAGRAPTGVRRASVVSRLRRLVPSGLRSTVKSMLPRRMRDGLTVFWRMREVDVHTARVFPLVADLQGYIRLNVRGREAGGMVDRGLEYDQLCEAIADGLRTFVDADTGEPLVADIARSDSVYDGAPGCVHLPDLIVRWAASPSSAHRQITSPRYGTIAWVTPGTAPDGRPGNHRAEGFAIAAGTAIAADATIQRGHIVDLAPTVFDLLGLEPRPEWTGTPLPLVRSAPTTRT